MESYKKFNITEIRKKYPNIRDYMIYMIRQFGSCGVPNWKNNLENLDNDTIRIIFVLLMSGNRNDRKIYQLENEIRALRNKIEVYEGDDLDE